MNELIKKIKTYQKNIDRGVKFLDKKLGRKKWLKRVKVNQLDLQGAKICITGQIFGNFWDFLRDYQLSADDTIKYGFYLFDSEYRSGDSEADEIVKDRDYEILTTLWFIKIKELKS